MTKTTYNKLETGLTCKIDKNGRIHVYKTKQQPKKLKLSEGIIFALFIIFAISILIISSLPFNL
jgi:hypothetical protein